MDATDSIATIAYNQVMEETGFYRDGYPAQGVFDTQSLLAHPHNEKIFRYRTVIDGQKLNARAVFELSGSPCIYFTQLSQADPDPQDLHRLHKLAWNHGTAPVLWVVTPKKVMLFNSYLKPEPGDAQNSSRYLLRLFRQTESGLRDLRAFASRLEFESGSFWQRREAKRISRSQRVDVSLLTDLREAEKLLVAAKLRRGVAHSLLGRSIFMAYLQDRRIVTREFMQRMFGVEQFTDALKSRETTYQLFRWIRQTFNGDLFPLTTRNGLATQEREEDIVENSHLAIVREFLSGTDLRSGQGRLWPYQFDVIPIELISSIYEHFVHANDQQAARERSTHYTPVNLVDLTLSQVFEGLPGNAKLADLSCGSGLFLVESLRRLVARRVADGEELSRALIRDTLYKQIYGVDISPEAIQIAAFSMYLALLELDPNPEQPPEDLSFLPLIGTNLFAQDAFDEEASFNSAPPFVDQDLSAIVGNPPWKRSRSNKKALDYCKAQGYPLALDTPDQAFMWRVGDFANPTTRIGLVLHAKPFFSKTETALNAKAGLLGRYSPRSIVNLSNLRKDHLFPTSQAPALVFIGDARKADQSDVFTFVRIDRSESFKRHGIIEVGLEGIREASTWLAASDPDWLKVASFGGPRDMALVQRLRDSRFVNLGHFTTSLGWKSGRGLGTGRSGVILNELKKRLPSTYLRSGRMPSFAFELGDIPDSDLPERARRGYSKPELFKGPLLICTRGVSSSGFYSAVCEEDLSYSEQYIGFSAAKGHGDQRHYLNAILNSALASYLLFLTGSVWGVERDKVERIDLLRLPIPDLRSVSEASLERVLGIERTLRTEPDARLGSLQEDLNDAVFDLYGLSANERVLVHDLLNLTLDLHVKRGRSRALRPPELPNLRAYAAQLISVIQPFLTTLNETHITAEIIDTGTAPLQVMKFSWTSSDNVVEPIQTVSVPQLQSVLDSIAHQLPDRLAEHVYARRVLRVYAGDSFYLIKPSQLRYWSPSAALNDADSVLSEHMSNGNGASSQAA